MFPVMLGKAHDVVPLPGNLSALTSLRFLAALWVVVFHYRSYAGLPLTGRGFIDKGYLAVDFFFVLSGFILAHVYHQRIADGTYQHGEFVKMRLARVYPLHFVTLIMFVVLALVALPLGLPVDALRHVDFSQLPHQLLLVHAWQGTGETFNGPSWSISAEFFAYLCFPLVMTLFMRPRLMLAAGFLATFGWYFLAQQLTGEYSTHTDDWRLMRVLPEFFLGAGLLSFLRRFSIPLTRWAGAVYVVLAIVVVLCVAQAPDWLTLLALVFLVATAAERGRMERRGLLEMPFSLWLGEISYALYMVHVLVGMAFFFVIESSIGNYPPLSFEQYALVALAILLSIVAAAFAWVCIENPMRRLIRGIRERSLARKNARLVSVRE